MRIADVIIQKLDALQATSNILLERVNELENKIGDNSLLEEYVPKLKPEIESQVEPKGPFKILEPKQFDLFEKTNTRAPTPCKKVVGIRGGSRRRYSHTVSTPPSIARELMEDDELAKKTRTSYEYYLRKILSEPEAFKFILQLRNEGVLTNNIVERVKSGMGETSKFAVKNTVSNSITVARRYGLTELVDKMYVTTDKFEDLIRDAHRGSAHAKPI